MSTSSHIQRSGLRRSTVVAAIAATAIGLTAAGASAAANSTSGRHGPSIVRPMPGSGCTGGCRRLIRL
jgi:hypothetical protein